MPSATPGGMFDRDVAPGTDPALALAAPARLGDDLAEPAARRAHPRRDDLAEERALDALHLAAAVADVAAGGGGAGGVPPPEQSEHSTAVSTGSSRVTPVAHSSRVSDMRISASAPGCTRLRGPRPRPPTPPLPPKKASMMSPKPKALNGSPPALCPPLPSGSPPRSTMRRFSGSDSTSYAALTSANRSCAPASGLTSGCSSRASRR